MRPPCLLHRRHVPGLARCVRSGLLVPMWGLLLCCGCSGPAKTDTIAGPGDASSYQRDIARFQTDPRAFLQAVRQRCDRLDHYTVVFVRQERLGLFFKSLSKPEHIKASFRARPLSIRFEWLDQDSQATEAVYVEGRNDNRLLLRPRQGFLGSPPSVAKVAIEDPVRWGQARNLITEFGLAHIMARTLDALARADHEGGPTITHKGMVDVEETGVHAHLIEIHYPRTSAFPNPIQQLFIDADTGLLAGTKLFLPDGSLDMVYLFARPQ
jgi:hypothetical protein